MSNSQQGEIWWANVPEPLGWRPVLILTRNDAIPKLHWITVAPLTKTIRGLQSEVLLGQGEGLPQPCVVTLDNIAAVEQDVLIQRITTLSITKMDEVWNALRYALDIPY
jgi:mRNA interferase MazF